MNGYLVGTAVGPAFGSAEYWEKNINVYADKWSQIDRDRLSILRSDGVRIAYWRSDRNGQACVGKNNPVYSGLIERVEGKLKLCTTGCLHASLKPQLWRGSRVWIVALKGEVIGETKFGAQMREILGECFDFSEKDPSHAKLVSSNTGSNG